MAPNKDGQSKEDEGEKDEAASPVSGVGGPYAQATDDPELATACFSGSDGKIYESCVAMRVLCPHQLHVEPPYQPNSSNPATSPSPRQAIPDTEEASCQPEKVICFAQAVSNTAGKSSSSLVEANTSNPWPQHGLSHNSEYTSSTGQRPSVSRKARTAHPSQTGEPPPGTTNNNTPAVASLDKTFLGWSALSAIPPRYCLLVALDDGTPTPFQSEYGDDLRGDIPQENDDSPLRRLPTSGTCSDFTKFDSSPIPFTDVGGFDFQQTEMQSESMDSAYFSNQIN